MVRPSEGGGLLIVGWLLALRSIGAGAQLDPDYGCPPQERILPCRCSHSELPKVLEGLKAVSHYVDRPVDELILENNNLPSLPGKVFATLRVLRLMLRNNRLERVSSGWLEGLHDSLLELFIVEPDLRSLPVDSLENLQGLEAVTLQSRVMKRLPRFSSLPKLRYLQINSPALLELAPRNFRDIPNLEQLHVFGSPRLTRLEAGLLRSLPRLELINVTDSGIHWIHPRAAIDLPDLKEVSLAGNAIVDAAMVGRACVDLPSLSIIRLDRNRINRLGEGSFVDLPVLSRLYLSRNVITEIFAGAFQRVPLLKSVDLNHNLIHRIHPEFFPRRAVNVLEEMWLINNDLSHVAEIRSVLEALPRLKFLDASHNQLEEIPFGTLRGHPTLERLHLNHNRLAFLQRETFTAMPALRELRLKNNSLSNLLEAPFWNLPALKGLDLSENYFRHIEPHLLTNLPSLRRLDLSGNAISLIEPESFLNTPALEHVNVSGNALSILHPLTFRHLTNLYELDVGWNRMLEVVPGLPKDIEHLHMPMNRIVALPVVSSQDLALPALRSLDLSANGIERIPPGTLADLPNLRRLNLGYNALRLLEDGVFDGLGRLEQLDLRYNRLVTLHGRSFRPLKSLMDVNLRGNRVEVLRPDIFQENVRLQRIDFSRNNLAQIPHATFTNTRDLRELYASHNTLTELPGSLHGLTALRVLDLSFNKLNILSPETLSSLSSLLELKLVRNRIRELREGAFDGLPRLSLIDLENNDLRVIERNAIRALPELQAVRLGSNRLQSIPSGAFTELPLLQSAELQENRIQEIAGNAFINVPHLLFLNLSHNHLSGLEYVGLESLRSLEVLDLSHNRLSRVSSNSLAAMEWLVELKMDNNRICAVHGSPFDDMPRLRVLSLRSNRMTAVSESAFKRLRSNIAVLDIDGNPLSCSCGMLWLRGWLQQASTEGPRCADGSLFKELRLSRQDCQRERYAEPVHPGCETEMINVATPSVSSSAFGITETVPLWMNLKDSSTQKPSISQDPDYFYEYLDYQQDNTSMSPPGVSTASVPTQTVKIIQPPSPPPPPPSPSQTQKQHQSQQKNATSPVKKHPAMPPSPSSSGFTFFGVPLPSLNFNLWGHSGRKAERKESSSSSGRPGRGRYRFFPPTEPEIHRGGFVPLPRAQSGFVPIVDPRLMYEKRAKYENVTKSSNASGTVMPQEERVRKSGNSTVIKVEKNTVPRTTNKSQTEREREELSTASTLDRSAVLMSSFESRKISTDVNKISSSTPSTTKNIEPIVVEETSQEAHETSVSTKIYDSESLEVSTENVKFIEKPQVQTASRIIWTTPKVTMTESRKATTAKEIVTTTMEVAPKGSSTAKWDLEVSEYEGDSSHLSSTTDFYDEDDSYTTKANPPISRFLTSVTTPALSRPKETTTMMISHTSRGTEASALSAFLIPGGQVPSSGPTVNFRPLGRSTITKVASPHLDRNLGEPSRERQKFVTGSTLKNTEIVDDRTLGQNEAFIVDEEARVTDDGPFNWYFQHYNDTNLEPYVGVVYGGVAKIDASPWLFVLVWSVLL
ncbi:Insulin-like growth factor-binding protein complex acid labile chain [Harpegnathos saltator]|uniref:Insulin-like growth factor-binding protein complex acid labile chain n=1 Tax=Harpegnathos saltator TaxID=610380 RepID=E2C967_HARSA|nr:Insulin-like growth factor-binding protein complex acid labile chain [Harpegnathos saltator]